MTEVTTLQERVEHLATQHPDVRSEPTGDMTTMSIGDRSFAVLSGSAIELLMDEPVARAATRTPDTTPSHRGSNWVRFEPRELDDHAIDRLEAWFAFAARKARG